MPPLRLKRPAALLAGLFVLALAAGADVVVLKGGRQVEGEIVRWLVQPGELVAVDQPICEIMTDKATVEISTPKGGRVQALHGEPGDVIKVRAIESEVEGTWLFDAQVGDRTVLSNGMVTLIPPA